MKFLIFSAHWTPRMTNLNILLFTHQQRMGGRQKTFQCLTMVLMICLIVLLRLSAHLKLKLKRTLKCLSLKLSPINISAACLLEESTKERFLLVINFIQLIKKENLLKEARSGNLSRKLELISLSLNQLTLEILSVFQVLLRVPSETSLTLLVTSQ